MILGEHQLLNISFLWWSLHKPSSAFPLLSGELTASECLTNGYPTKMPLNRKCIFWVNLFFKNLLSWNFVFCFQKTPHFTQILNVSIPKNRCLPHVPDLPAGPRHWCKAPQSNPVCVTSGEDSQLLFKGAGSRRFHQKKVLSLESPLSLVAFHLSFQNVHQGLWKHLWIWLFFLKIKQFWLIIFLSLIMPYCLSRPQPMGQLF